MSILEDVKHHTRQGLIRLANVYYRLKWRRQLRHHGYQALSDITSALRRADIAVFADFGTLLGLVRDGKLMDHDLDLDFGVLASSRDVPDRVRAVLEKIGCLRWREYAVDGQLAMQSYLYPLDGGRDRLKFDINYYVTTADGSRTWLLFRDPVQRYEGRELSVAEMNYSPITVLSTLALHGIEIPGPARAEALLEEKYGASWRVPDLNWIYWKSPAATELPLRINYVQFTRR